MSNIYEDTTRRKIAKPSPWVLRWSHLIDHDGSVLDLAAGGGRHGRVFLNRGNSVIFVDQSIEGLADLRDHANALVLAADLENGGLWPLDGKTFDAVIIVNYLYRPLFPKIISSLKPGGVLIYETFAQGNEAYGRPRNPNHLLKCGELLERAHDTLHIIAYEHGLVTTANMSGVKQRLCAVKVDHAAAAMEHPI